MNPAWPHPARPRLPAWLTYLVQHLVAPNRAYRWLARRLEAWPLARRLFTAGEKAAKGELFGCRMCGQCTLPVTGYACPMTCPKQLRNGPCGGVGADGSCEVYPGERCVWVVAYERAERRGHTTDLHLLQRPIDQRQWGRSSWVSYWLSRDDGLCAPPGETGAAPGIWRSPRTLPGEQPAGGPLTARRR
jgi:Methylene-tetrahydrofolate reductase C terminal